MDLLSNHGVEKKLEARKTKFFDTHSAAKGFRRGCLPQLVHGACWDKFEFEIAYTLQEISNAVYRSCQKSL